jgi:hypothetical protein
MLLTPALSHAIIFDEDGVIDGGTYDDVYIINTATVDMTAGIVGTLYVENAGTLNFSGGTISEIELRNSATFNLENSSLSGVTLSSWGSGNFNLNNGSYSGWLESWEYSHNTISDGQLLDVQANLYDYVVTDIYGGNVTWDFMSLHGYSVLNIYGGDVSFNNGFNLHEDAEINVYYQSVIETERPYELLGYVLLDGTEFLLDQFTSSEIEQMNFQYIPEPTSILFLFFGASLIRKRNN